MVAGNDEISTGKSRLTSEKDLRERQISGIINSTVKRLLILYAHRITAYDPVRFR